MIEAGLPNITGMAINSSNYGLLDTNDSSNATGAFYVGTQKSYRLAYANDNRGYGLGLDASRSSSIYGNSSTVQPPAISTNFCIKY